VSALLVLARTVMAPAQDADPGRARQEARDILDGDEFRTGDSLAERAGRWIGDHLPDFPDIGGNAGGGGFVGTLVEWAVLLGLVALLVWIVVTVLQRWAPARTTSQEAPSVEHEAGEPPRPARYWRAEAERLEAEGRWAEALRARYRELIADLAEAGIIAEIPGRTAGEYRGDLAAGRPADAPAFEAATGLFEGAWYGGQPTGQQEALRFRELAGTVRRTEP
jgi:hypothetical protein